MLLSNLLRPLLIVCLSQALHAEWQMLEPETQPTPRHEAAFVELDGKFYLLGGRGIKPVEVYDPVTNRWEKKSPTPIELHHFQPLAFDGKIYVIGAFTGPYPDEKPVPVFYIYDPVQDTWATGPEIPEKRRRGSAGVVMRDGRIYMVCGIVSGHQGNFVPWLDEYDPKTGKWTELPDAPHARDHFQAAVVDGKIVAAAGRTSSGWTNQVFELTVPEVDVYDIASRKWRTLDKPIPTPRAGNMAAAAQDRVIVLGGESGTQDEAHSEVEALNVKTGQWDELPRLITGRHGTGVAYWNGALYTAAGCGRRGGAPELNSTEKLELEARGASRAPDGDGSVEISGELKQWHKVTLTLDGPFADERDNDPNPFTDHSFWVTFRHESGNPTYAVPGYFAADGDAAETSARSGTRWRAHLSPDKPGVWTYRIAFHTGDNAAFSPDSKGAVFAPADGKEGQFTIAPTDKRPPDFRARGRLDYVGGHHLQFQGDKTYFLKAGADAPETLLAYADFDGTSALKPDVPLKTWKPHVRDWKSGDPIWKDGKGKGLIGALNYLSSKGMNGFSFLTYNVDGDGSNVWPFVSPRNKLHYDCSKLDQWEIVFDHATAKGLHLHFKLQENEIDDQRVGYDRKEGSVPAALDGGKLGPERKLYLRELGARFGHALALNWNIGEENTQSTGEVRDMFDYLRAVDPYNHPVVLHTFPGQQDQVYRPLLGYEGLTGVSLQNEWNEVHRLTAKWIAESGTAGHPWVCANDEQGSADTGVPPDPGYPGKTEAPHSIDDIRKLTLWGNFMAGGAGVEYYFGYALAENDLLAQDWRSRDQSWDYARIALEFFRDKRIPFQEMSCRDELLGNEARDNSKFCLAKVGELYLVYLPNGGSTEITLPEGDFTVSWFNPRTGESSPRSPLGSNTLTAPDDHDWLAVIRR